MRYLDQWIKSPTGEECPLAGKSSYGNALSIASDKSTVLASHFRTYHTPLKTQEDFINALAAANRIADDLSARTGAKVYPYSLFYVFFDQVCIFLSLMHSKRVLTIWSSSSTLTSLPSSSRSWSSLSAPSCSSRRSCSAPGRRPRS